MPTYLEFAAQERNLGEEKADIADTQNTAYPRVPEEDGLDLGKFGVGKDEGKPQGSMDEDCISATSITTSLQFLIPDLEALYSGERVLKTH